jgi:hypothetical protein
MSVRPFILSICRIGLAAFVCALSAGVSRAEDEGSKPIEIVPSSSAAIDTNALKEPLENRLFGGRFAPHAPQRLFGNGPGQGPMPLMPPPPQQAAPPSQRDKELMDRRRNWVFTTPEEMMGTDVKIEPGKNDDQNLTVMERYYQRLYDADRNASTNGLSKMDKPSWNRATNAFSVEGSSPSPFYSAPDSSVFQPAHVSFFAPPVNSNPGGGLAMPSPEEIRLQQEQQAHMDSFKQMWDIDQPKPAAVSSSPLPVQSSSSSPFGAFQDAQVYRPNDNGLLSPSRNNGNSQTPDRPPTVSEFRNASRPPHADFSSPPQRPF